MMCFASLPNPLLTYKQPRDKKRGYPMRSVFCLDHHGDAVALLQGSFDMVVLAWPNLDTPFG